MAPRYVVERRLGFQDTVFTANCQLPTSPLVAVGACPPRRRQTVEFTLKQVPPSSPGRPVAERQKERGKK